MANSIIVLYSTPKNKRWAMKLYSDFNPKHITKKGISRISLDDGSFVIFAKPHELKKLTKKFPTAMVMREDEFIKLHL